MDLGLTDRIVVVSGAGQGIGLGTAEAFLAEGAKVVAGDIDCTALREHERGGRLIAFERDLLDPAGAGDLIARAVAAHGRVDVLVNIVGGPIAHRPSFLAVDDDNWRKVFDLNLMTTVRACRAAIPHMERQGKGAIVSIASDLGRQPDPVYVDYAAAKAAIISLSKTLSIEFGPKGIRSNVVSPGPTRTPGLVGNFARIVAPRMGVTTEEALRHFVVDNRRMPLERFGEIADVAAAILFLASDRAAQVTGSEYRVDGGSVKMA